MINPTQETRPTVEQTNEQKEYLFRIYYRSGNLATYGRIQGIPKTGNRSYVILRNACNRLAASETSVLFPAEAKHRNLDKYFAPIPEGLSISFKVLLIEPTVIPGLGHCYDTLFVKVEAI